MLDEADLAYSVHQPSSENEALPVGGVHRNGAGGEGEGGERVGVEGGSNMEGAAKTATTKTATTKKPLKHVEFTVQSLQVA